MPSFDKQAAMKRLGAIPFTPRNHLFLQYWFSLFDDEGRLRPSDFSHERLTEARHFAVAGDVIPGKSVTIRRVGNGVMLATDRDLTGADLLAMLPVEQRTVRLRRSSDIATGALAHNTHWIDLSNGHSHIVEEVIVPFGDFAEDGSRVCLAHMDLSAFEGEPKIDAKVVTLANTHTTHDLGFTGRSSWV